jgi:Ribbon-helix-helix protein, copG family
MERGALAQVMAFGGLFILAFLPCALVWLADLTAEQRRQGRKPSVPRCAMVGVMARLNLTLDEDTLRQLDRYTKRSGKSRAALASELLREGLAQREAAERRTQLAADYAAGRGDARALLKDLEARQLELIDDEAT